MCPICRWRTLTCCAVSEQVMRLPSRLCPTTLPSAATCTFSHFVVSASVPVHPLCVSCRSIYLRALAASFTARAVKLAARVFPCGAAGHGPSSMQMLVPSIVFALAPATVAYVCTLSSQLDSPSCTMPTGGSTAAAWVRCRCMQRMGTVCGDRSLYLRCRALLRVSASSSTTSLHSASVCQDMPEHISVTRLRPLLAVFSPARGLHFVDGTPQ
jgi:hypothetical protein